MANSRRDETNNVENPAPPAAWKQPIAYHGVTATGRGNGYFFRVPMSPVLATIAEVHGAAAADLHYGMMLRSMTQACGARAGAKGVEKTREAELNAIVQTAEEVANGTYKARGDEIEAADSDNRWNRTLLDTVRPYLRIALETGGYETSEENIKDAFAGHYEVLVEKYGVEAAAKGFTPTKKGVAASVDKPKMGNLTI